MSLSIIRNSRPKHVHLRYRDRFTRKIYSTSPFVQVSEEVREAVHAKRPMVALESTIYTHGLPFPKNLELAKQLDCVVRENGGIPATIGILQGVARVGLTIFELENLMTSTEARKVSRRDLAFAVSSAHSPISGGTTVAGTMILAHLAGIKVFATGGLGGVHRGGQSSLDISADLTELGRTPVAVISSGCKGFLDIPRTLEYLETQGVGVATFRNGREGDVNFPAFWSRDSGHRSPTSLSDEAEAAAAIHAQTKLPLSSGLLLANPVPLEHSIPREELDTIIAQALHRADQAGIHGSRSTPYVLDTIKTLSGGRSVLANRALVESNVKRGTRVAVELSELQRQKSPVPCSCMPYTAESSQASTEQPTTTMPTPTPSSTPDILVAGSVALDTTCTVQPNNTSPSQKSTAFKLKDDVESKQTAKPRPHTSNPSCNTHSPGGVGLNIARSAALSGARVKLFTVVGDDYPSLTLKQDISRIEEETSGNLECVLKEVKGQKTASYVGFNDAGGGLWVGMGDMRILEQGFEKDANSAVMEFKRNWGLHERSICEALAEEESPRDDGKGGKTETDSDEEDNLKRQEVSSEDNKKWLITDANWNPSTLHHWLRSGRNARLLTAFEPVSTAKCVRLFDTRAAASLLHHPSPNRKPEKDNPRYNTPQPIPRLADLATPNLQELVEMDDFARSKGLYNRDDHKETMNHLSDNMESAATCPNTEKRMLTRATSEDLTEEKIPERMRRLLPFVPNIITKLGERGVLLMRILFQGDPALDPPYLSPHVFRRDQLIEFSGRGDRPEEIGGLYARLFPPPKVLHDRDVVSVNGAGDTFLGALVAGLSREGKALRSLPEERLEEVVESAQKASALTLGTSESVSPNIRGLFRHGKVQG